MSTSPTDDLERQLGAAGDRDDARQMTAYMKGRFEFFGVKTPQRRTLSKNIERASKSLTIGDLIGLEWSIAYGAVITTAAVVWLIARVLPGARVATERAVG